MLAALLALLLLTPPDTVRTPDGFDLQGHRGARGLAPENTWPAFKKALALGVTTLEMDVVISQDGRVVVSHDPWMSPAFCQTPDGAPVQSLQHVLYQMPYARIRQFDCGQRPNPEFPEQQLTSAPKPLLRTVIERAEAYTRTHDRPAVFYNIETKSRPGGDGQLHPPPDTFAQAVYDVLQATGVTARSTLQSFDVRTLQVAHRRDWPIRLALLVADGWGPDTLPEQLAALGFTPAIYSPEHTLVDAALVEAVHERGMQLIPWTVNDPDRMRRLIGLGVDGLITDYPNRALPVLSNTEPAD
ncbi:glycerophosphodiester phosphodiesterase [Salisaeta longa]|uniref:glycerophosphodiester phosphodiesterase n=1 Tax=Salisaeta longa TaxID=503170 RepID=UPI0003B7A920|nr:glycerophosphodiester phosphodiesterase [Salisaeta longa]